MLTGDSAGVTILESGGSTAIDPVRLTDDVVPPAVTRAIAGSTTTSTALGEQDFSDGEMMWTSDYVPAQAGEPAPFDTMYGFDSMDGPSFSQSWTFNYAPITEPITSASITVGVYNHDSVRPGDQVASFGVDGHDLTTGLNALFNASGGADNYPPFPEQMEYNVYTLVLPPSALAALADGSAMFSLTMQNGFAYPGGGAGTDVAHNGMGLDFSALSVTTAGQPMLGPTAILASDGFSQFTFTFSEAIDPTSFAAGDVVLTGPGGDLSSAVTEVSGSGDTFTVAFPTQTEAGRYTITIGPNILDLGGNPLDQDGDLVAGEPNEDQFTAWVDLVQPAALPLLDDFEAGHVGESWIYNASEHADINDSLGYLSMTANTGTSWAEAILLVDLRGLPNVNFELDHARNSGETSDTGGLSVGDVFTGRVDADLIALSDDGGATWIVLHLLGDTGHLSFDLDAFLAAQGMTQNADFQIKLHYYNVPASNDGRVFDNILLNAGTLDLVIAADSFSEGAGAAATTATVTRSNTDTTQPLVVTIGTSDDSEARPPLEVTIPANEASVAFAIDAVDDVLPDGPQSVIITAMSPGFISASDDLTVFDDEPPTLLVEIAADALPETAGMNATLVTIRRNRDLDTALQVILTNSDATEIYVPPAVTIPAGAAAVQVSLDVANDGEIDGDQTAKVSVSAAGWAADTDSIQILDDDVIGQRTVGGALTGMLPAGDYLVPDDLVVPVDETLALSPPSTLRFYSGTGVYVYGQLLAEAATGSEIIFTSAEATPAAGDWNGINLRNGGQPRTALDYVEVSYATTAVNVYQGGSNPLVTLSHSNIHDNNTGVNAGTRWGNYFSASGVQIVQNVVHHNQGTGVYLSSYSSGCDGSGNTTFVADNEISHNAGAGVRVDADSSSSSYCIDGGDSYVDGTITRNYIHHNQEGVNGYSARYKSQQNGTVVGVSLVNNLIADNTTNGVRWDVNSSYSVMAAKTINNTIVGNGGAGILHAAETDSGFTIRNNIISGNTSGIEAETAYTPVAGSVGYNDVASNGATNWGNYPAEYGDLTTTNANGTPADAQLNISADPRFVAADDLHLSFASPAIDAGTTSGAPDDDFEGELRVGLVDMGWDEVVKPTITPLTTPYQTPGLSGTVAQADVSVTVWVDGRSYAAMNRGDGTWSLAADTISPPLDLGTYDVQVQATDATGESISDETVDELVITTLIVTGLTPMVRGFTVTFNGPVDAGVLNLYDSVAELLGPEDVTLRGAATGPVHGSLILSDSNQQFAFVCTEGPLPADTYTVTLRSADNGFRAAAGGPLDGNADGTSGDDYRTTFTVDALPAGTVRVSLPDFARGAGQPVNIPSSAAGLPIRIDDAVGMASLAFKLSYDPALLNITAASRPAGVPADWTVGLDTSTPGVARITASGPTPLSGTNLEVVRLTAAVPSTAPYGAVQAVRLEDVILNGEANAAIGDVAVHKAVYLGDADGTGIHSSADAFLTVQAALGLASGFAAHAWTDPRIAGDADGSGILSAADAFLIVQEGLGLAEPFVPDNPHIAVTPVGGGVDPQFRIDRDLPAQAGCLVSVPVHLEVEAAATNVGALDFDLFFDASQLTIELPTGVSTGADTAGGWSISLTLVAAGHVRVAMLTSQGQPLGTGRREIARLQFRVDERAAGGSVTLDIEPVDAHAGGYTWTAADGSVAILASSAWRKRMRSFDVDGDGPRWTVMTTAVAAPGAWDVVAPSTLHVAVWPTTAPLADYRPPWPPPIRSPLATAREPATDNLRDRLVEDLAAELPWLEAVLADLAEDVAAA